MECAALADVRYSGRNSGFTKTADIEKILEPLTTRMYQTEKPVIWDALAVFVHFASRMNQLIFQKNELLTKIGESVQNCIATRQGNDLEQLLNSYKNESSQFFSSPMILAEESLLYAASLPAQFENPLYFFNAGHIDKYVENISNVVLLLEKLEPHVSWLDRLEKVISLQLQE